ncbi:MAG TPA: type VII secretion protein EccB [Candidatus Limnocylindrales bacterium]|nr:type VII secretion protein EccB [Candidatus Limnocylindrales bacterium]
MWTQRDQLQAYQFMRRRMVTALQAGDANLRQPPNRRVLLCFAIGALCALLIITVFVLLGIFGKGGGPRPGRPTASSQEAMQIVNSNPQVSARAVRFI